MLPFIALTYRWRREIAGGSAINSHSGGGSFGISGSVITVTGCATGLGANFVVPSDSRATKKCYI